MILHTVTPDMFKGNGMSDAQALNAMFQYMADTDECRQAIVSGDITLDEPIVVQGEKKHIHFDLVVRDSMESGPLFHMLEFRQVRDTQMSGRIELLGIGATPWATRATDRGFIVTGACNRATLPNIEVRYTVRDAAFIDASNPTNVIDMHIPQLITRDTGPSVASAEFAQQAVLKSHSGSPFNTAQSSLLEFSGHGLEAGDLVLINGEPHHVSSIAGEFGDQVTVFPRVAMPIADEPEVTYVDVTHINGCALRIKGGNTTGFSVGLLTVQRAGMALWDGGLYGLTCRNITIEACPVGIVLGSVPNAAQLGGNIQQVHPEGITDWSLVKLHRTKASYWIGSMVVWAPHEVWCVTNNSDSGQAGRGYMHLQGVRVGNHSVDPVAQNLPENVYLGPEPFIVKNTFNAAPVVIVNDTPSITLEWDPDADRLSGQASVEILVVAPNGAGNTVTINGTSYPTLATGRFFCTYNVAASAWVVRQEQDA